MNVLHRIDSFQAQEYSNYYKELFINMVKKNEGFLKVFISAVDVIEQIKEFNGVKGFSITITKEGCLEAKPIYYDFVKIKCQNGKILGLDILSIDFIENALVKSI